MEYEKVLQAEPEEPGVTIVNSDGVIVDVNSSVCSLLRTSEDRLIGRHISDFIESEKVKAGQKFQLALYGEQDFSINTVQLGDGEIVQMKTEYEPFQEEGERFVKANNTIVSTPEENESQVSIDDIEPCRISEITENLRVDTSGGTMTLDEIMLDLTVGEDEVTKYKKGALSLHQAIDERLEEEEKRNPNSEEVAVLREVGEAAFSLYERIQNGDRN
jgi:PAS domain S-box-containing protein